MGWGGLVWSIVVFVWFVLGDNRVGSGSGVVVLDVSNWSYLYHYACNCVHVTALLIVALEWSETGEHGV